MLQDNTAYTELNFYAYNWTEIERGGQPRPGAPEIVPGDECCYYLGPPNGLDLRDWQAFFTRRRKPYILFEGTANPRLHRRTKYPKVWALCAETVK